jgi:hypothetical protein
VRWTLTAIAAVLAFTAPFAAAAAGKTQAAWTDPTRVSATVTAGTWQTAPPASGVCVPLNPSGKPLQNATCSVGGITFQQWEDGSNVVRDYYIAVTIDGPSSAAPLVTVDLSKATGTGTGTWAWGSAITVPTGQFTLPADFHCSELPTLRAIGPSNWGSSYAFWVRVVQGPDGSLGSTRSCG